MWVHLCEIYRLDKFILRYRKEDQWIPGAGRRRMDGGCFMFLVLKMFWNWIEKVASRHCESSKPTELLCKFHLNWKEEKAWWNPYTNPSLLALHQLANEIFGVYRLVFQSKLWHVTAVWLWAGWSGSLNPLILQQNIGNSIYRAEWLWSILVSTSLKQHINILWSFFRLHNICKFEQIKAKYHLWYWNVM